VRRIQVYIRGMRFLTVLLLGIASLPLVAGTVSIQADSDLPVALPPSDTSCAASSPGNVSFEGQRRNYTAHVSGSATADFGSITGYIGSSVEQSSVSSSYSSYFQGYVTVFGGSGVGTLITHYQLISMSEQNFLPGLAVSPSYSFSQGNTGASHTPALPQLPRTAMATLIEEFDVISPVIFGEPILLSASTGARHGINVLQCCGGSFEDLQTSSSAQITGYTALDSSGATLAGATVMIGSVPEPGTLWSGMIGALIFTFLHRRRLSKAVRPRQPYFTSASSF